MMNDEMLRPVSASGIAPVFLPFAWVPRSTLSVNSKKRVNGMGNWVSSHFFCLGSALHTERLFASFPKPEGGCTIGSLRPPYYDQNAKRKEERSPGLAGNDDLGVWVEGFGPVGPKKTGSLAVWLGKIG